MVDSSGTHMVVHYFGNGYYYFWRNRMVHQHQTPNNIWENETFMGGGDFGGVVHPFGMLSISYIYNNIGTILTISIVRDEL
jgi:hypothetical protein